LAGVDLFYAGRRMLTDAAWPDRSGLIQRRAADATGYGALKRTADP